MPHLTDEELKELSREEPPWKPGDTLRLEHPRGYGSFGLIATAGSLHTLRRLYFEDGCWMVVLEGSFAAFYARRFSLASATKPRYKTKHKLGVPKGKLP